MADTKHKLKKYKQYLESNPDGDKVWSVLCKLDALPVSISLLQDTGVGKLINSFRKKPGDIGTLAKTIVGKWKSLVTEEARKATRKEPEETEEYVPNSSNKYEATYKPTPKYLSDEEYSPQPVVQEYTPTEISNKPRHKSINKYAKYSNEKYSPQHTSPAASSSNSNKPHHKSINKYAKYSNEKYSPQHTSPAASSSKEKYIPTKIASDESDAESYSPSRVTEEHQPYSPQHVSEHEDQSESEQEVDIPEDVPYNMDTPDEEESDSPEEQSQSESENEQYSPATDGDQSSQFPVSYDPTPKSEGYGYHKSSSAKQNDKSSSKSKMDSHSSDKYKVKSSSSSKRDRDENKDKVNQSSSSKHDKQSTSSRDKHSHEQSSSSSAKRSSSKDKDRHSDNNIKGKHNLSTSTERHKDKHSSNSSTDKHSASSSSTDRHSFSSKDKHSSSNSKHSSSGSKDNSSSSKEKHSSSSSSSKDKHSSSADKILSISSKDRLTSKSNDSPVKSSSKSKDSSLKSSSKSSHESSSSKSSSSKHSVSNDNKHSSSGDKTNRPGEKQSSSKKSESGSATSQKHKGEKRKISKIKPETDSFNLFSPDDSAVIKKVKVVPKSDSPNPAKDKSKESKKHSKHSSASKSGENSERHDKKVSKSSERPDKNNSSSKSSESSERLDKKVSKSSERSDKNNSSSKSSKSEKRKLKVVEESNEDITEGFSFDDFLNCDVKAQPKKFKKDINGLSSGTKWSSSLNTSKSSSSKMASSSSGFSIPKPKQKMDLAETDILSLLPETNSHYRPIRPKQTSERKFDLDTFDPMVIGTKQGKRTMVYSGRRHGVTEMKPLYNLCLQVLIDNIDAIEHVGGVPYDIMRPVLERCSVQQLLRIEDHNPQFVGDTEDLWSLHCEKEFKNYQPEEMEAWREMYLRCVEEREERLEQLRLSMNKQAAAKPKGRQVQLAYVDNFVKPPRDILRKQQRYGTGKVVSASNSIQGSAARMGFSNHRVSIPQPKTMKSVAPMMQKINKLIAKHRR